MQNTYKIEYREYYFGSEPTDFDDFEFLCQADSKEHAIEQFRDAEKENTDTLQILAIWLQVGWTENPI